MNAPVVVLDARAFRATGAVSALWRRGRDTVTRAGEIAILARRMC